MIDIKETYVVFLFLFIRSFIDLRFTVDTLKSDPRLQRFTVTDLIYMWYTWKRSPQKETCNLRHPMGLCRPVSMVNLLTCVWRHDLFLCDMMHCDVSKFVIRRICCIHMWNDLSKVKRPSDTLGLKTLHDDSSKVHRPSDTWLIKSQEIQWHTWLIKKRETQWLIKSQQIQWHTSDTNMNVSPTVYFKPIQDPTKKKKTNNQFVPQDRLKVAKRNHLYGWVMDS